MAQFTNKLIHVLSERGKSRPSESLVRAVVLTRRKPKQLIPEGLDRRVYAGRFGYIFFSVKCPDDV